jgi:F420-dependent oxidoreductase-like protein
MKIGLQIPWFTWPGNPDNIASRLAEIARTADESGFASVWMMDHMFQIGRYLGPPNSPMLEGYSALCYLAAVTQRVRLGTLVTAVTYRTPGLLIKTVTNLDVLSGGRAMLGIGAGWNVYEAASLGLDFPPLKERFERLEETLQIAHQMWAGDRQPYHGRHYQLEEPILSPPQLSRPHPPILVGGLGEKKTLKLAAKYGDACNLFWRIGPAEVARKLDVLKRHCDALGRPYAAIERTVLGSLGANDWTPASLIATCREMAGLGIQHAIFNIADVHEIKQVKRIGREVVPAVADL